MRLRHALRRDLDDVADIWFDAFTGDPFLTWVGGGPERWAEFGPRWLRLVAETCFERGHTHVDADRRGAIAWIPPDLPFLDEAGGREAQLIIEASAGEERAGAAFETMQALGPLMRQDPHWTLQWVGVRSAWQGAGLGADLVGPGLSVADVDGLPTALVSSNPRNVPFYERQGFVVSGEVTTPDAAATIRAMERPARG